MNALGRAIVSPIAAAANGLARVGSGVAIGSSMLFTRSRSWGLMLGRTRYDYRTEIGDPLTNSIVGAVVGWIARNFPEAPVKIVREAAPEELITRSLAGPGAMLRLLERPNDYYSGVLQWMATIADFVLGNAYWLKRRSANDRVVELWWVPAWMIEAKWPEDEPSVFIGWYEYKVDGITYVVEPRDVVHFRNGIDPRNPRKGLSRLGSLFREIFTDDEAANFTASLLRNLGVPGVMIAPSNTTGGLHLKVDPENVKKKWKETFGGDNRGDPVIFTAPTDVKVLSFNPQEMDLKALRRIPEERISAVLGVPAAVAGLGAGLDRNTFSNFAEANRAAYTQGVIPLHRLIAAELEVQLLPDFADKDLYDVYFDASVTAAMQEAADAIWKRHESASTKGLITRAAFKRAINQPVAEDGSDDVYILPNNYTVEPVGGNQPPDGRLTTTRTPPPALGPGTSGEDVAAVTLTAVRCSGTYRGEPCDHLLGEMVTTPYRLTCGHCKTVNEAA